jgi:inner membrane protein
MSCCFKKEEGFVFVFFKHFIFNFNMSSFLVSIDQSSLGYFWLVAGILMLLLELFIPGLFFFIAFSFGCGIAAIFGFLLFSFKIQCVVGFITSVAFFIIIKRRYSNKKQSRLATNIEALVNQDGIVIQRIESTRPGRVRIKNEEWPAISTPGESFEKNTVITVVKIQGNKLLVKSIK